MENLHIYNQVREVPPEAKKAIGGGKLKGKTDINPMWRLKKLTEVFGVCGIGWWTSGVRFWTEPGAKGEVAAFCELYLTVVVDGKESKPIFGIGGSGLVNIEKEKLVTNDDCFKMAYTDAISVACKALGFGANVYFEQDTGKYTKDGNGEPDNKSKQPDNKGNKPTINNVEPLICEDCGTKIVAYDKYTAQQVAATTLKNYGVMLCTVCGAVRKQEKEEQEGK